MANDTRQNATALPKADHRKVETLFEQLRKAELVATYTSNVVLEPETTTFTDVTV